MPSSTPVTADIVVIGAGHNAMIAAAYLARAGLEVAVLEAREAIGGNTITEELTLPGWQHDSCSSAHVVIQGNPVIRNDELGLISEYGLKYEYTDPAAVLPLGHGDAFVLHRSLEATAAEIARFSAKDAQRFVEMITEWNTDYKPAHRRWNAGESTGDGSDQAYEELRRASSRDVVYANFEHPVTRRMLVWMGFANFQPPDRSGTGVLPISIVNGRLEYGWATPVGGSGALPAAAARLVEAYGGSIHTGRRASRILVSGGRASGVETVDGSIFLARRAVVSSAHMRDLASMFDDSGRPGDIARAAGLWRPGIALFAVHAALRNEIRYTLADGRQIVSTSGGLGGPEGTLRQVAGCQTGVAELDDPWMLLVSSTVADPSRAPGATFKILTAAPATLSDGRSWDDFGPEYGRHLLRMAGKHVSGLEPDNILAVRYETPASLARRSPSNIGGSCHGGEFVMPDGEFVSGWAKHTTDLDGLFLTGSTSHPGGSVSGWPGRNAARVVLAELGVDAATARRPQARSSERG